MALLITGSAPVYLAATSSVKTPGATDNFMQMTGNSISIPANSSWILTGGVDFGLSTSPAYTSLGMNWCSANGADTNVAPTALSIDAGRQNIFVAISGSRGSVAAPTVRFTNSTSSPVSVFLVPYATETTPANARVTTYIYGELLR